MREHSVNKDHVMTDLIDESISLKTHKIEVKMKINDVVDHMLEEEVELYPIRYDDKFSLGCWISGVYYLTIARITNPLAYKMAWRLVEKLKQHDCGCQP